MYLFRLTDSFHYFIEPEFSVVIDLFLMFSILHRPDPLFVPGTGPSDDDQLPGLFDLPWHDVIFPHLFTYLPIQTIFKLRAVSQTGYDLVRDYFSVAKVINIARIAGKLNSCAFQTITRDNTNLVHLNLRNAKDWLTDSVLCPVLKENHKIQSLDLTNCITISNSTLQILSMKCPHVQTLILRDCHWLSVEGLSTIALNLDQLEKIDITGCWNVNDESIILLVMNCKK